jgi:hypothetical protein
MKQLSKNPFLLVGVSADAEMSDIRKAAQRLMMEHRLDGGPNSPAARRIETALQQLQDPVERFHWGLYWPELTNEEAERIRADSVLSTLADNPLQDAASAYERIAANTHPDIRSHNLGVLSLLQAIAATEAAQTGTTDDITDDLECASIWKRAFGYLQPVVTADSFWMRKKLWARQLGDKRLNDARLANIRETYVGELLAPAGAVISKALLDGHARVAKTYVELIRASGFEANEVEATLSRVYKPLADRVERTVAELKARLEAATDGDDGKRQFRQLLTDFERGALKDLEVMIAVGDLPGYAEEHARDTSAEFLRSLSIASWNQTSDGTLSEQAITIASRIADSTSIRSKLREDLSTIQGLAKDRELSERLAQRYAHLKLLLDSKRWKDALPVIRELQSATSGDASRQMAKLHSTISNNVAIDLFERAIQALKNRRFSEAHALLDESLQFATKHEDRITIMMAQSRIPKSGLSSAATTVAAGMQKAGCLIYFALLPIAAAITGLLQAIHAYFT